MQALASEILEAQIAAESEIREVTNQIDERLREQEGWSRLLIGYAVVLTWILSVLGLAIWLMVSHPGTVCTQSGDQRVCVDGWTAARDDLNKVLTVAVLPIVTLVLGYYFGRREGQT